MIQHEQKLKRTQVDIVTDILRATREGLTKTQLVHKCNLNFKVAERYVQFLLARGFLMKLSSDSHLSYRVTVKGLYVLMSLEIADELFASHPGSPEIGHCANTGSMSTASDAGADPTILLPYEITRSICKYVVEGACNFRQSGLECRRDSCPIMSGILSNSNVSSAIVG